jgi:exopolyphosphatase/pppGpp-phosphohydrolase
VTTHYAATFDATKALVDASKGRRETILAALQLMSVAPETIKGEVWIDEGGLPRKVLMRLRQRFTQRDIVSVNMSALVRDVGVAAPVPIPPREQASRTDDVSVIARGAQSASAQLGSRFTGGVGNALGGGGSGTP